MKKYLFYIFAVTVLASCKKTSDMNLSVGNTMTFAAHLSGKEDDWSGQTRGAVTDNNSLADFSTFCFRTGRLLWDEVGDASIPDKMFDVAVERDGGNWSYDPPVMWSGGDGAFFTFFGYSPCTTGVYDGSSNPSGNNIEVVSTSTTTGAPVISFATRADVSSQVDLLVAKPVFDTRPVDRVTMTFIHALSQVRFKAWAEQPNTTVSAITIKGVKYKGSLKIDAASSWVADPATTDYICTLPSIEISTDKDVMTNLSGGDNAFMLLPQDLSAVATAVVEFTYAVDGVARTKQYELKENWVSNKAVTYTVNLTEDDEPLEVVAVAVTPWVLGTDDAGDADAEVVLVNLIYNVDGVETLRQPFQGQEVKLLAPPTAAVHYVGWNTKADMTGEFYFEGDSMVVNQNTTLYAQPAHTVHQQGANCYPIVYGTDPFVANSPVKALVFNALLKPRSQNGMVNQGSEKPAGAFYIEGVYGIMNNEAAELNGQQLTTDLKSEHIKRIEVVWQSNTDHRGDVAPATTVIKRIRYNPISGECTVVVRGRGNAYIAAYDSETGGNILWSWHIWSMESEFKSLGVQSGIDFMDRNLGAIGASTVAATNDNGYKYQGLFYTFGNKEPSPGIANHSEFGPMPFYDKDGKLLSAPAPIRSSDYQKGYNVVNTLPRNTYELLNTPLALLATVISDGGPVAGNPTIWSSPNSTRLKTIYDPCPPGYMIPSTIFLPKMSFVGDNYKNKGAIWINSWWPNTSEKLYSSFTPHQNQFQIWSSVESYTRDRANALTSDASMRGKEKRLLLQVRCMRE